MPPAEPASLSGPTARAGNPSAGRNPSPGLSPSTGRNPSPRRNPFAGDDEPSRPGPPRQLFVVVPVVVSFFAQVPASVAAALRLEGPAWQAVLVVVLALVGPVALAFARRAPGPVVVVVTAAACADLLVGPGSGGPYLALAFALVSAIVRGRRAWAFVSVAIGWMLVIVGSVILRLEWRPARVVVVTLGILLVLGAGEFIRTRVERAGEFRRRLQRHRDDVAQAERVRIARELHDVLAHSLSQINVQAGVGLHLIDEHPEKAAEALASIRLTSKAALDEVRGVLGFLRGGEDVPLVPQPGLERLPELVLSMSSDDLSLTLSDHTTSAPSAAVQLALYRIAQESLTNVVRHAGATAATVVLSETPSEYRLVVQDNGSGPAVESGSSTSGRGLLGMRERVEQLGGTFSAGRAGAGREGAGVNGARWEGAGGAGAGPGSSGLPGSSRDGDPAAGFEVRVTVPRVYGDGGAAR